MQFPKIFVLTCSDLSNHGKYCFFFCDFQTLISDNMLLYQLPEIHGKFWLPEHPSWQWEHCAVEQIIGIEWCWHYNKLQISLNEWKCFMQMNIYLPSYKFHPNFSSLFWNSFEWSRPAELAEFNASVDHRCTTFHPSWMHFCILCTTIIFSTPPIIQTGKIWQWKKPLSSVP